MADYSFYSRSELMQLLMNYKNELGKYMIKPEPSNTSEKTNLAQYKTKLETEINAIEAQLKAAGPAGPSGGALAPTAADQAMIQSMKEQVMVQNLQDVIRSVPKMVTGDSMEKFIAEMDQIYQVEVQGQLTELPRLEGDFTRATKRLLTNVMYSQMAKSGQDTTSWDNLKKYLITNHGSKITMFQHLTRLWNLEAKPEEKFTDFCAKLEEEVHTASVHIKKLYTKNHTPAGGRSVEMSADDVFKLVGAMLASIQVRKNHEEIFKAMIKKMDSHWTASSLGADAQDYIDRLGSTNNVTTTGAEIAFIANAKNPKSSDQKKSSAKKTIEDESSEAIKELQQQNEAIQKTLQSLTLTNVSSQTGGRGRFSMTKGWPYNRKRPRNEQICFKFNNGTCTGNICPDGRRHVDDNAARLAIEDPKQDETCHYQEQPTDSQLNSLFGLGPDLQQ